MAMIDEWSAGCLRQQLRVDKALRSGRTRRLPRSPLAACPADQGAPGSKGPRSVCARPRPLSESPRGLMEVVMTRKDHCHGT